MKTICFSLAVAAAIHLPCAGEETSVPREIAAVTANARAYEEAYAKGDVDALLGFFTEDAEYVSDDGRTFSGREALASTLREAFRLNKGAKLKVVPDTVRALSEDVAVEKGTTLTTDRFGEESEALYTAVHVRRDGAWKISELIETPVPEATPATHLAELSWLIGAWEESDETAGLTIHSNYQWARGGNFITRTVTVSRGDDPLLEGWQIIGWDPVAGGIRSWTFDDEGGCSEGTWTREGRRWLVRDIGYAADGSRTAADQTITRVSDDMFTWESGNRTVDGDPRPGIGKIEIRRVKGGE